MNIYPVKSMVISSCYFVDPRGLKTCVGFSFLLVYNNIERTISGDLLKFNEIYRNTIKSIERRNRMRDADLIAALKQQKEHAVEELLTRYSPLIRYVISPILPSGHDQEECILEVAMRVWEKVALYDETQGSWTGWLTSVARNVALNRARGQRQHQPLEDVHMEIPSKEPTPEEIVIQKEQQMEMRNALQLALRELSSADEALFYRKYYYLQSTAQIAAEMGLSERAVEGRLYRIKKRLRKKLGGDVHE